MNDQELRKLLKTARQGDEQSFTTFFKICYQKCSSRINGNSKYEDAFMNAMFKFWEKYVKEGEEFPTNIMGYFYRMADNGWKNDEKSLTNKITGELDLEKVEFLLSQKNKNVEHNPLIQEEVEQNNTTSQQKRLLAIDAALEQLGDLCKEILTERMLYQTKLKDLEGRFGFKNYDTLKSKASQCKKKLIKLAHNIYSAITKTT